MGKQSEAFLEGEGKAWLKRNSDKINKEDDPVITTLKTIVFNPKNVLEVGCADGWRLMALKKLYGCAITGIDPGLETPMSMTIDRTIYKGVASDIGMCANQSFDLVIYGFCLYLCDPDDYFKIAAEGHRVLKNGGLLVIYDFYAPVSAYATPYAHKKGLMSYHYNFGGLWGLHPCYSPVTVKTFGKGNDATAVTIFRKNMTYGFPVKP